MGLRSGQALVVILLILAVVATVGLSIASRSVTEISTSTTSEEAARALDAAEAGIEAQLGGLTAAPNTPVGANGASYTVSSIPFGSSTEATLPDGLAAGEGGTIFLTGHDASGNVQVGAGKYNGSKFTVCWGQGKTPSDADAPALEVAVYFEDSGGIYKVSRNTFDPVSARAAANGFYYKNNMYPASGCPTGKTYSFSWDVSMQASLNAGGLSMPASFNPIFLRLRLFYNGDTKHSVGVKDTSPSSSNFSQQGQLINSTGQAGATARKVQLFQRYPDPLSIFDGAIFSGSNATK